MIKTVPTSIKNLNKNSINPTSSPRPPSLTENYLNQLKNQNNSMKSKLIQPKFSQISNQNKQKYVFKQQNTVKQDSATGSRTPGRNSISQNIQEKQNKENLNFQNQFVPKILSYNHVPSVTMSPITHFSLSRNTQPTEIMNTSKISKNISKTSDFLAPTVRSITSQALVESSSDLFGGGDGLKCQNHQNKKAKYRIENLDNRAYCSKCAIALASQGHKIIEIQANKNDYQSANSTHDYRSEQDKKEQQVSNLLKVLNQNITVHGECLDSFFKKREGVERFYTKQILKVEQFFKELLTKIQQQKIKIFEELNSQKCASNDMYICKEKKMNEFYTDYKSMQQDIELNYTSILTTIELQPFQEIMSHYTQQQQEIDNYFEQLQNETFKIVKYDLNMKDFEQLFVGIEMKTNLIKRGAMEPPTPSKTDISVNMEFEQPQISHEAPVEISTPYTHTPYTPYPITSMTPNPAYVSNIYVSFENKGVFQNAIEENYTKQEQNPHKSFKTLFVEDKNHCKSSSNFGNITNQDECTIQDTFYEQIKQNQSQAVKRSYSSNFEGQKCRKPSRYSNDYCEEKNDVVQFFDNIQSMRVDQEQ